MDLDRCTKLANEVHHCPHCNTRLSCCEAPPFHIGDGLGWGTDILFICLNNDCPLFAKSWETFEERYGHRASCRYMLLPGEEKGMTMMVGSADAFTGSIIDVEGIKKQNERHHCEVEYTKQMDSCLAEDNLKPALCLVLDDCAELATRRRACDLLIELNKMECIDPIRNHKFVHSDIEMQANLAIRKILENHHNKECPHCMEIVKAQAKVCKHCNREL